MGDGEGHHRSQLRHVNASITAVILNEAKDLLFVFPTPPTRPQRLRELEFAAALSCRTTQESMLYTASMPDNPLHVPGTRHRDYRDNSLIRARKARLTQSAAWTQNQQHAPLWGLIVLSNQGEILVTSKWGAFWAVAVLCALGSIALIYIAYQTAPPENSSTFIEVTKVIFLCLGGVGVLLPITLNVMNSLEQRHFQKIENTFDLLSKWDDEHLLKARNYTRKIKKNRQTISDVDLINQIKEDEALEQSVILVTNYFEHVRFSLKQNRIDISLFKSSLGVTLLSIMDRFWPYYEDQFKEGCGDLRELKAMLK